MGSTDHGNSQGAALQVPVTRCGLRSLCTSMQGGYYGSLTPLRLSILSELRKLKKNPTKTPLHMPTGGHNSRRWSPKIHLESWLCKKGQKGQWPLSTECGATVMYGVSKVEEDGSTLTSGSPRGIQLWHPDLKHWLFSSSHSPSNCLTQLTTSCTGHCW